MCGIFGSIGQNNSNSIIKNLIKHSEQRGRDSSGIIFHKDDEYKIHKANYKITKLTKNMSFDSNFLMGHSRLITNGLNDNQPPFCRPIFDGKNFFIEKLKEWVALERLN